MASFHGIFSLAQAIWNSVIQRNHLCFYTRLGLLDLFRYRRRRGNKASGVGRQYRPGVVTRVLLGPEYAELCLYHSRSYARAAGEQPSKLCHADKLSIAYEPWWFYLSRAWLSGELSEYRRRAAEEHYVPESVSHRTWFKWIKGYLTEVGQKYVQQG